MIKERYEGQDTSAQQKVGGVAWAINHRPVSQAELDALSQISWGLRDALDRLVGVRAWEAPSMPHSRTGGKFPMETSGEGGPCRPRAPATAGLSRGGSLCFLPPQCLMTAASYSLCLRTALFPHAHAAPRLWPSVPGLPAPAAGLACQAREMALLSPLGQFLFLKPHLLSSDLSTCSL